LKKRVKICTHSFNVIVAAPDYCSWMEWKQLAPGWQKLRNYVGTFLLDCSGGHRFSTLSTEFSHGTIFNLTKKGIRRVIFFHHMALVSVGAVGAAAPTDFQTDWFCTHRFLGKMTFITWIFTIFIQKSLYCQFFRAFLKICTNSSEILAMTLYYNV